MNEIDMMKRITTTGNLHIVSMIGCVTRSEPVCLMCELVAYGSLLSYLRTHRNKVQLSCYGSFHISIYDSAAANIQCCM